MAFCLEILVLIAMFIIDCMIYLVTIILRSSWIALHVQGISRASNLICVATSLHLLSALVLGIFSDSSLILSPDYSKPALILSFIILLTSALFPGALQLARKYPDASFDRKTARTSEDSGLVIALSYAIAICIVLGGLSFWSSQQKRVTLHERICTEFTERLQQDWKDKGAKALDWTEKLTNKDLRSKLPCRDMQG